MPTLYPDDYAYHPEHLWLRTADGGEALIGLSHFAQEKLKKIVYVDLPPVGTVIAAGEPFGTIESNKVASDLIAPVSGEVVACNLELGQQPGLVNSDCYNAGWLIRIGMGQDGAAPLLSAAEYMKRIGCAG